MFNTQIQSIDSDFLASNNPKYPTLEPHQPFHQKGEQSALAYRIDGLTLKIKPHVCKYNTLLVSLCPIICTRLWYN